MIEQIENNENIIRASFFISAFILFAAIEILFPRRKLQESRLSRWAPNLAIIFVSTGIVKLLNIVAPAAFADAVHNKNWGILNHLNLNTILSIIITIVVLDFVIYWQHRLMHRVNILWKLHYVHHTDLDLDVSSGNRFHPLEIIISIFIKLIAILILGPLPAAVIIFEIILNFTAQFNHSNIKISSKIDEILRRFIVTPDFHIVHHSVEVKEQDSNFGFNLAIWDILFRTYKDKPEKGCEHLKIGVKDIRNQNKLTLIKILALPFRKNN